MILIDTDICIELLRGNRRIIEKRKNRSDDVAISFMTAAELFYGAEKSQNRGKNIVVVEKFIMSVPVLHTDIGIARMFGELKSNLSKKALPVSDADIIIAATALAKCTCLVTGNTQHFSRFEGLRIENWAAE